MSADIGSPRTGTADPVTGPGPDAGTGTGAGTGPATGADTGPATGGSRATGPDNGAAHLAGLDALESAPRATRRGRWPAAAWRAIWPKALAISLVLVIWQVTVWSGWRPEYIFPGPAEVLPTLADAVTRPQFWTAAGTTLQRAVFGFAVAVGVGLVVGFAAARFAVLRAAVGSLITGLQTMPSIAWFPLAIVLFQGGEASIFFVVVLGAAPSVANGVLAGVDYVPPLLVRAGRNMGATGLSLYRTVIGPASLPAVVAGLKQGWAFSWRSLMAGELLVAIGEAGSLGNWLQQSREVSEYSLMMAIMLVILAIGIVADTLFTAANNAIRRRWGLIGNVG